MELDLGMTYKMKAAHCQKVPLKGSYISIYGDKLTLKRLG